MTYRSNLAKAIHLFGDRSNFKVGKADLLAVDNDILPYQTQPSVKGIT
ncbi:hypothetical protein [Nostoc sp. PA-18-2419]|nr:hypothetical protein [Nostoc sp. PA-18-2419]